MTFGVNARFRRERLRDVAAVGPFACRFRHLQREWLQCLASSRSLHQSFWEYHIERRIGQQSLAEQQVETRYGRVYRVIAKNGIPLDQPQQQQEDARLKSNIS
jgi:transposase